MVESCAFVCDAFGSWNEGVLVARSFRPWLNHVLLCVMPSARDFTEAGARIQGKCQDQLTWQGGVSGYQRRKGNKHGGRALSLVIEDLMSREDCVGHSNVHVVIHVVFCTKQRTPWLTADLRPALFSFMSGVVRNCGCHCYRVGGVEDHVHLAILMNGECSIASLVRLIKIRSTHWLRSRSDVLKAFSWQTGYAAFGIDTDAIMTLCHYLDIQVEHHGTIPLENEFRALQPGTADPRGIAIDFD